MTLPDNFPHYHLTEGQLEDLKNPCETKDQARQLAFLIRGLIIDFIYNISPVRSQCGRCKEFRFFSEGDPNDQRKCCLLDKREMPLPYCFPFAEPLFLAFFEEKDAPIKRMFGLLRISSLTELPDFEGL